MTTAIHLQDVVKAYRLGSRHGSIKERVLRGRNVDTQGVFRALDNVDLEVEPGEILGILGDNGSGKSTLLKLVAGITEPTSGTVQVHGTVASLLEVGVGFHPEMTGYENVRLSGALLGMEPEKLEARIPDIVAFSELEGFMETPVKHYSSGMFLRLGFAIGAFVDPDVILVDEVLAVGDQLFQRKCDDHLRRLRASGSTVVVVSHNLHTIQSLCTRCVVLDRGKVLGQGRPIDMVALYRQHLFLEARARGQHPPAEVTLWNRYGRFEARIERVEMRGPSGEPEVVFETGESLTVDVHWTSDRPLVYPAFAFSILDDDEREVYTTGTHIVLPDVPEMAGCGVVRFEVQNLNLLEGYYSLQLGIAERPDGPGSTVDFYQGQDFQRAVEPFMVRSQQAKKGVTGITDLDLLCAFLPEES